MAFLTLLSFWLRWTRGWNLLPCLCRHVFQRSALTSRHSETAEHWVWKKRLQLDQVGLHCYFQPSTPNAILVKDTLFDFSKHMWKLCWGPDCTVPAMHCIPNPSSWSLHGSLISNDPQTKIHVLLKRTSKGICKSDQWILRPCRHVRLTPNASTV